MRGAPGPGRVSRSALRSRQRSRCSPRSCAMPARRRATKPDAARPDQRHKMTGGRRRCCCGRDRYTRQSNSTRCRRTASSRSRRRAVFLLLPATLALAPGGSGLIRTRTQHGADGGAPPVGAPRFPRITDPLRRGNVAHHLGRPREPVIFPPRGADLVLGALPDIEPVGPVDHPAGIIPAGLLPPFPGVLDLRQQVRAARRVLVLALAQRLLDARGFQRVQHRAGHVLLQQARLDRRPAAPGRALHAPVRIRPVARVPPVMQPPPALGARRDPDSRCAGARTTCLRRAGSANSRTSRS